MKINVFLVLFIMAFYVFAARNGSLNRESDVVTGSELGTFAVDVGSLESQIDTNSTALAGGITTNYVIVAGQTLSITNGVIKGIN